MAVSGTCTCGIPAWGFEAAPCVCLHAVPRHGCVSQNLYKWDMVQRYPKISKDILWILQQRHDVARLVKDQMSKTFKNSTVPSTETNVDNVGTNILMLVTVGHFRKRWPGTSLHRILTALHKAPRIKWRMSLRRTGHWWCWVRLNNMGIDWQRREGHLDGWMIECVFLANRPRLFDFNSTR